MSQASFALSVGIGALIAYGAHLAERASVGGSSAMVAFGGMPAGNFFGTLFFMLMVRVVWTSSIALMQPSTAWLVARTGLSRHRAAILVGSVIWVLGIGTVLSFNLWAEWTFWAGTVFDNIEYLVESIILPFGALLIAVFAGWVMSGRATSPVLAPEMSWRYRTWLFIVRWLVPAAVIFAFLHANDLIPGL